MKSHIRYHFITTFGILLMVAFSSNLLHGQTIITDRPDQTESSALVSKGSLQIESGMLLGYSGDDNESQRLLLAPSTLFRIGLTEYIELRVLNQFESLKFEFKEEAVNGISDLQIGTKIKLFDSAESNTAIAFLTHLIIPTGSKYLTSDEYGTINKLAISHKLSSNTGIGYNIGYNNFGQGNGDLTYTLSVGIGINDKASVYLESYGDVVEFEDYISSFDTGFTYLVSDNFQLDFSFGAGINHKMNYLSFGFSWLINKD